MAGLSRASIHRLVLCAAALGVASCHRPVEVPPPVPTASESAASASPTEPEGPGLVSAEQEPRENEGDPAPEPGPERVVEEPGSVVTQATSRTCQDILELEAVATSEALTEDESDRVLELLQAEKQAIDQLHGLDSTDDAELLEQIASIRESTDRDVAEVLGSDSIAAFITMRGPDYEPVGSGAE